MAGLIRGVFKTEIRLDNWFLEERRKKFMDEELERERDEDFEEVSDQDDE